MRCRLLIILVLSGAPLLAQSGKFQGYIMNAGAFRTVHSFCVDTHNLPPEQINVINRFVSQESRAKGLLTRLPWHRRTTCEEAGIDAIVRLEFPHDNASFGERDDVEGVLLVFRPGSPSPIYETPAVTVDGPAEEFFRAKLIVSWLEYNVAANAVRILIHDWQQR